MQTRELLNYDYLDKEEQWAALVELCRRKKVIGLDTEFYNVDPSKESCVGRAKIHVFSIAVRLKEFTALGYHKCRGWMLPVRALEYQPLVDLLEDPSIRKEIHNQPVDHHALANHRVRLRGARNTLDYVRWTHPGLVNLPGRFKLKALMLRLLYRPPICSFKELVSYVRIERVSKERSVKKKVCECLVVGCRKRKGHAKTEVVELVTVWRDRNVKDKYPLESIVEGHERWLLLLKYAIEDAVAALQIAELADEEPDPAPWPYGGVRPGYSQADCDATIALEEAGIPIDVQWCRETAVVVEADEERELVWLFRWFVANSPWTGPWRRENGTSKTGKVVKNGVDAIWGSPTKKVKLFDALGFPASPIWAKGKVKPGTVKLDWKALEWISRNHEPAKQVIKRLLHLQKIRSNKKYVLKLRDSGGCVHPICGPAGDEDDRSGAVTGRKAIKGEFEAQQLPTKEEKDLYAVRRAVIAG